MKNKNGGLAPIVIIIIAVIIAVLGYGGYKVATRDKIEFVENLNEDASKIKETAEGLLDQARSQTKELPKGSRVAFVTVKVGADSGKNAICEIKSSSGVPKYFYFSQGKVRRESFISNSTAVTVYANGYYYYWLEKDGVYRGNGVEDFSEAEARAEKDRDGLSFDLSKLNTLFETSLSEARCVETSVSSSLFVPPKE